MRNELKNKRLEKGYTQQETAIKARISKSHYSMIENGERIGSLEVWISILNALEIPEEELTKYMKQ